MPIYVVNDTKCYKRSLIHRLAVWERKKENTVMLCELFRRKKKQMMTITPNILGSFFSSLRVTLAAFTFVLSTEKFRFLSQQKVYIVFSFKKRRKFANPVKMLIRWHYLNKSNINIISKLNSIAFLYHRQKHDKYS